MPSISQKDILLIIPYFGKWPIWFDAFLVSVEFNPRVHFLCPTDCEVPKKHPQNIQFVTMNFEEMNEMVDNVLGYHVPLSVRKLCDVKVAYGDVFSDFLSGYRFWGICDLDIIWGDILGFLPSKMLEEYDIITSRKGAIAGHFTIFKNTFDLRKLYLRIPMIHEYFKSKKHYRVDELAFTEFLADPVLKPSEIKLYWESNLLFTDKGAAHQEYLLNRWLFKEGKLFDTQSEKKSEYMYLHFINWKRTMKFCECKYPTNSTFYVSFRGVHLNPYSGIFVWLNNFKNFYNGYHIILWRKKWLSRYKKKLKIK